MKPNNYKTIIIILPLLSIFLQSCIHFPLYKTALKKTSTSGKYEDFIGRWYEKKYSVEIEQKADGLSLTIIKNTNNKIINLPYSFTDIQGRLFVSLKMEKNSFGYSADDSYNKIISSKFIILLLEINDGMLYATNLAEEVLYHAIQNKILIGDIELYDCVISEKYTRKNSAIPNRCLIFDIQESELKKLIINNDDIFNREPSIIFQRIKSEIR